jgi:hypothetical protein
MTTRAYNAAFTRVITINMFTGSPIETFSFHECRFASRTLCFVRSHFIYPFSSFIRELT